MAGTLAQQSCGGLSPAIDLKQLYDVDLRPMPLTEAERDAMLETLKKAKQAL